MLTIILFNTQHFYSTILNKKIKINLTSFMKKKTNINNIFNTNLNKDSKSILFNTRSSDTGEIKYLPPVSKE
jgi:hypothetical protein